MACVLCLQPLPKEKGSFIKFNEALKQETALSEFLKLFFIEQCFYFSMPSCCICNKCYGQIQLFFAFHAEIQEKHRLLSQESIMKLVSGDRDSKNDEARSIGKESAYHQKFLRHNSDHINAQEDTVGTNSDQFAVLDNGSNATEVYVPDAHISLVNRVCTRRQKAAISNENTPLAELEVMPLDVKKKISSPPISSAQNSTSQPIPNPLQDGEGKPAQPRRRSERRRIAVKEPEPNLKSKSSPENTNKESHNEKAEKTRLADEFIAANFKLSCCICDKLLNDFTELKRHFRSEHQQRGFVMCCNKKLLKRGLLVDHLHTHNDPDFFKCKECGKAMANRQCYQLHIRNHVASRDRIYNCDVCSKSFFRRTVYHNHMLTHIPEEQRTESCTVCEKSFATKSLLNQHFKSVHLKHDAQVCDICGKVVRGRFAFERHQYEHAGTKCPKVTCEICGVSYSNKYRLRYHMKMMHTEENLKPQICPICQKVSPNVLSHKRHMDYTHSMERKHMCSLCGKAFKKNYSLKEHMTTHTGEVLYTCPHCPKTFNSRANMHSHRKKAHRAEWEAARQMRALNLQNKTDSKNLNNDCSGNAK